MSKKKKKKRGVESASSYPVYKNNKLEWVIKPGKNNITIKLIWDFWTISDSIFMRITDDTLIETNNKKKIILDMTLVDSVNIWFEDMLLQFIRIYFEKRSDSCKVKLRINQKISNDFANAWFLHDYFDIQVIDWAEVEEVMDETHTQHVSVQADTSIIESPEEIAYKKYLEEWKIKETPGEVILVMSGVFDHTIHWEFESLCELAIKFIKWRKFVIDLTDVSSIENTWLGILLLVRNDWNDNPFKVGNIVIFTTKYLSEKLKEDNFHRLFDIYVDWEKI